MWVFRGTLIQFRAYAPAIRTRIRNEEVSRFSFFVICYFPAVLFCCFRMNHQRSLVAMHYLLCRGRFFKYNLPIYERSLVERALHVIIILQSNSILIFDGSSQSKLVLRVVVPSRISDLIGVYGWTPFLAREIDGRNSVEEIRKRQMQNRVCRFDRPGGIPICTCDMYFNRAVVLPW